MFQMNFVKIVLRPLSRGMCLAVRQNFSPNCELKINEQIGLELKASYEYLSMAYFFNRSDMALPGAFRFFKESSAEENEHAQVLMEYMNSRGGTIVLKDIPAPAASYTNIIEAMKAALKLEMDTNQALLDLHEVAEEENDPQLCDFIASKFLAEQVKAQKGIADYIRQLEWCEKELGTFVFDSSLKNDTNKLHE